MSLAVLAAGATQAAVTPLYSEYGPGGSGDLPGSNGLPPTFVLDYGLSSVTGILSASRNGPLAGTDSDAVRFVLGSGLELVGVSVTYSFDATVGGGWAATVEHALRPGTGNQQPTFFIHENISGSAPGSGSFENLFDGGGGFTPLGGSTERQLDLNFESVTLPGSAANAINYRYTLVFNVQQATAIDVPEPGSLPLTGLGLAGAALVACRRRRGRRVPAAF